MKTPTDLNKALKRIEQSGLKPVTKNVTIQQTYAPIIIPSGLKNSGKIMSYNEARRFVEKYNPQNLEYMTKENYDRLLNALQENIGDRLTVRGERQYQKERMINTLKDAQEYFGDDFDFSKIPQDKLSDAFRYASNKLKDMKNMKQPSEMFYEFLSDYLKGDIASE